MKMEKKEGPANEYVNFLERIRKRLGEKACSDELVRKRYNAAVLIPLIPRMGEWRILFEVRSDNVSRHPGQIGFPGGSIEEGEVAIDAAVRELEEELGIGREDIEILGKLGRVESITGAVVEAYVCSIDGGKEPLPDGNEVREIFEVPLERILKEGLKESVMYEHFSLAEDFPVGFLPGGRWERSYEIPLYYFIHEKWLIWGLTARILKCFADSLV